MLSGRTVRHRTRFRSLVEMSCLAALVCLTGGAMCPQEPPASTQQLPTPSVQQQATMAPPCIQPAPMPRMADYNGPLQKLVGSFARPLERKAVPPPPRYRSGVRLCTLNVRDKFALFVQDSLDPVTFLGAG